MDEVMDMVSSYVNCAYVQYRPDTQLPMDYFSDELWRMLGYGSGGEFSASFRAIWNTSFMNRIWGRAAMRFGVSCSKGTAIR